MTAETNVFTIRIPSDKQAQLDSLAAAMDRPRSWVVNQAIEDYLETQSWQIAEIKKALEEADAGDFADEAQVKAVFHKYNPAN